MPNRADATERRARALEIFRQLEPDPPKTACAVFSLMVSDWLTFAPESKRTDRGGRRRELRRVRSDARRLKAAALTLGRLGRREPAPDLEEIAKYIEGQARSLAAARRVIAELRKGHRAVLLNVLLWDLRDLLAETTRLRGERLREAMKGILAVLAITKAETDIDSIKKRLERTRHFKDPINRVSTRLGTIWTLEWLDHLERELERRFRPDLIDVSELPPAASAIH